MMKVFEFVEVVARFHNYVMRENTGNAEAFSKKLGISRSCLYNLIEEIRSYGIDVEYSREKQTYKYVCPDSVEIKIVICQHEK